MDIIPIGAKVGKLTILEDLGSIDGKRRVKIRCDCGNITYPIWANIKRGLTKSCGCLIAETAKRLSTTHGLGKPPEFHVWSHMKNRCNNPNDKGYSRYGGRGIRVCEEWLDFATFYRDMGPRPSPNYSIERIDNNGNYEPGNCKWIPRQYQARNRRNNTLITFQGITLRIGEWNTRLGFPVGLISQRIHALGWSVEKACSTPLTQIRSTI